MDINIAIYVLCVDFRVPILSKSKSAVLSTWTYEDPNAFEIANAAKTRRGYSEKNDIMWHNDVPKKCHQMPHYYSVPDGVTGTAHSFYLYRLRDNNNEVIDGMSFAIPSFIINEYLSLN